MQLTVLLLCQTLAASVGLRDCSYPPSASHVAVSLQVTQSIPSWEQALLDARQAALPVAVSISIRNCSLAGNRAGGGAGGALRLRVRDGGASPLCVPLPNVTAQVGADASFP